MAKVLAYYSAVTNMRGYIYYNADGSGGGVQYESGTVLHLPTDYASRETNSRYPVTSPMSGWMNKGYIQNITAVYESTAPGAVSIVFPSSGATSGSTTPVVAVKTPTATSATLYRRVDSGSWTALRSSLSSSVTVYDKLSLSAGSHSIQYKMTEDGIDSSVTSLTITVVSTSWSRTISTGSVISNANISHRKDINEMLTAVNVQRKYYGLSTITLTGTVGKFADWAAQMKQMAEAVNACLSKANQTQISVNPSAYPDAATVNAIRAGCKKA